MTRKGRTLAIFLLAVAAVLLGMSVRVSFEWLKLSGAQRPDPRRESLERELANAVDPFEVFTKVATFVAPSVVSLSVENEVRTSFGERILQEQGGTGIIADTDGHILTNYHVIGDKPGPIQVELANGKRYRGQQVAGDAEADLAVVRIDAPELRPAVFGDSDTIQVGQSVIAIGNAFELRGTVTHGIVSAKARPVGKTHIDRQARMTVILDDYIQTDAPINPGNSGGPLADVHGRVIGINTLIYSRSGASAGVGFAIPINYAKQVLRQILETGHVVKGGIGVKPVPQELQRTEGGTGFRVDTVTPGSPADAAGIEPGDKIVEFDGRPIKNFWELRSIVLKMEEGTQTSIKVQRGRRSVNLPITVGAIDKINQDER